MTPRPSVPGLSTGADRKRAWRIRNPERSRTAERERAQRRRVEVLRGMQSSYARYEHSWGRTLQRFWYPTCGPRSHKMTKQQRLAALDEMDRRDTERTMALLQERALRRRGEAHDRH